jgi:S-DNA-T family DNA segregation ATPase FtsK/SpoIIIE
MATAVKPATRMAEFLGLLSFATALMLLISLATYHPSDPAPFFKAGPEAAVRNFIGPVGAFLAELLIPQLFGLAAHLLPIALGIAGWKLFWCRPIDAAYTKLAGLGLMLLSLTGLLTLSFGTVNVAEEPVRAGGAVGELVAGILIGSFNRTGAFIVVATSLFVSVILATQFSFAALARAIWALASERGRRIRTAWAHLRETRRKERMRREVVRKHSRREEAAPRRGLRLRLRRLEPEAAEAEAESPQAPTASPPAREPALAGEDDVLGDFDIAPGGQAARGRKPGKPAQQPLPFMRTTERPAGDDDQPADDPPAKGGRRRAGRLPEPVVGALPPASILDEIATDQGVDAARLHERARTLQAKSAEFGVHGKVVESHPGPVVTTYEFKPEAGVKYSRIVGLADDLALGLEAESIRIDRMSGRGTVAIEIPNEVREMISLREMIEDERFQRAPSRLTLALGKTVGGDSYVTDLASMPHLLIAGATGTGKSVGLNSMIASILFKATPEEVRLILIDPKRLELGVYEEIPHLLTPVVTDPKVAANVLKWAVSEMERRIRMLASEGVRNIDQFNNIIRVEGRSSAPEDGQEEGEPIAPLHYIVIIIDELADLMMVSSREVEESITRLAQMARAVGIHLILATQRPSVDVLTGLIKANFPSRISFRVAARVDSRTILDSVGAERLLGRGDMLFLPPGSARLTRIHGAYVSEKEIARLTSYLKKTGRPVYDDSVGKAEKAASEGSSVEDRDALFDEAARFVVGAGQASTSMLQRRFRIGFSRAGRLIDIMEQDGIIGPADGSKPREILVASDYYETVDAWPR